MLRLKTNHRHLCPGVAAWFDKSRADGFNKQAYSHYLEPSGPSSHAQVSDNDPAKWALALNNARNLQDHVGAANVDIQVVAFGLGVGMLTPESTSGSRIADAMKDKIKVTPARTPCAARS